MNQLNLTVVDTVFNPALPSRSPDRKISYLPAGEGREKPLYKVWLYVTGADLPFIKKVQYRLHPTFPNPVVEAARSISNPNCLAILWTWGVFDVNVTVFHSSGATFNLVHPLTYGREIESAKPSDFVIEEQPGPGWTSGPPRAAS